MEALVVGAGIGGILGGLALKELGYEVLLLEANERLGGCAGTFIRNGFRYNVGATTLPGFKPGYPMERLLTLFNLIEKVKDLLVPEDPVLEVNLSPERSFFIFSDPKRTCEELSRCFPKTNHQKFFSLVEKTTKDILTTPVDYKLNGGKLDLLSLVKSAFRPQKLKLLPYLFLMKKKALSLLSSFYQSLPNELLNYFRAQTLIVAQVELEKANALAFILSLGYFFTGISYCKTGIGGFLEVLAHELPIKFKIKVERIEKRVRGYVIRFNGDDLYSNRLLISFPFLENLSMFSSNKEIIDYFSMFTRKLSPYSAFVVYGKLKRKAFENFQTKHVLILTRDSNQREKLDIPISGYLYLSFLEQDDKDFVTFTISTHTPLSYWKSLDEERVKQIREDLEKRIVKTLVLRFALDERDIVEVFSATPFTFKHYVGRLSLGGFSASIENPIWSIPSNITPFEGMYLLCDHAFAGQGFMGIALGCQNLRHLLKTLSK